MKVNASRKALEAGTIGQPEFFLDEGIEQKHIC